MSLARSLGLYYNLARPLGLHHNHYMSLSVHGHLVKMLITGRAHYLIIETLLVNSGDFLTQTSKCEQNANDQLYSEIFPIKINPFIKILIQFCF